MPATNKQICPTCHQTGYTTQKPSPGASKSRIVAQKEPPISGKND